MGEIDIYLAVLDEGYFEMSEAFRGLADEHVWKRPAENLLSAGEIAGHVAYWQAVKFAGEGGEPKPDPAKCRISSPLIDSRFSYYTETITKQPSTEHLSMSAKQVCDELLRVHREAVESLKALNPDLDSHPPTWPPHYKYRFFLSYGVIHIAYHTGQIYSARYLFGEQPPDN